MPKAKEKHRGHNEGTVRQRPSGLWEARVSLPDGRRASYYGKTSGEVRAKMKAALNDLDDGHDPTAGKERVGDFLDRWLADVVKPAVRPSTYDSYATYARLYLKPALGDIPLRKLAPGDAQRMMNDRLAAGLSPRTVQYMRAILRRALGQALKWGMVRRNVATLVDPPRSVKQPVQPLTADQARTFLDATKDDRLGPLFHVAMTTGLRQGELFGLRWDDVDLTAGTLSVRYAMQRVDGKPTFVEPKTAKSRRTIPLAAATVAALKRQHKRQLQDRLLAGSRWQDWGLVFASTIGTPLNPPNVTHRLQRLLSEAGLPRQRFHDLRHLAASLLLAAGVPARSIMEQLGHSQISLTMNTYAHLSPALMREAADAMDAILTVKAG